MDTKPNYADVSCFRIMTSTHCCVHLQYQLLIRRMLVRMCVLCMNVNWKTVNNKTPKVPMDQQSNLWISQGQVHCVDMYAQLQTMTYA